MSKCVYRTDLRLQPVGEPLLCIDASEIYLQPSAHTVNECVQMLLTADEMCLGVSEQRSVMRGPRLIGFIRITDAN